MRAFADAIKLVDRLVEYSVVAVVKQYYLITTGAILTLVLPWLEDRYFASAAQTDLKFFIDRWSLRRESCLLRRKIKLEITEQGTRSQIF
jgi:hypothetical protein